MNCYGKRPELSERAKKKIESIEKLPKSQDEIQLENEVKKWKHMIKDIPISPFNSDQWSE